MNEDQIHQLLLELAKPTSCTALCLADVVADALWEVGRQAEAELLRSPWAWSLIVLPSGRLWLRRYQYGDCRQDWCLACGKGRCRR